MRILLTAFDPFGTDTLNPAWEAVRAARVPEGVTVRKLQLPTSFARAPQTALEAIETFRPDVVLCFGLAAGRSAVTPETRAFNLADARIPDNDGAQPCGEPLIEGAPDVLYTPFSAEELANTLRSAGIPAEPSDSAGRFVCNALFYHLLYCAESTPGLKVEFIHVPATPSFLAQSPRKDLPVLPETVLSQAVEFLLREIS